MKNPDEGGDRPRLIADYGKGEWMKTEHVLCNSKGKRPSHGPLVQEFHQRQERRIQVPCRRPCSTRGGASPGALTTLHGRDGPFFEITDGTPSIRRVVGYHPPGLLTPDVGTSLIAFREWATDRLFYERLVDGEEHAVATFKREKALIDREA